MMTILNGVCYGMVFTHAVCFILEVFGRDVMCHRAAVAARVASSLLDGNNST